MTISLGLCVYTYTCAKDDVWICGRIYSDMNGGCGKLNEHNIHLQGSYLCSNSNCIQLDVTNCVEYSLFPGQVVLVHGRNPDGKRFICKQIVEPTYPAKPQTNLASTLLADMNILVCSGPYMANGSLDTNIVFNQIADMVRNKSVSVLVLVSITNTVNILAALIQYIARVDIEARAVSRCKQWHVDPGKYLDDIRTAFQSDYRTDRIETSKFQLESDCAAVSEWLASRRTHISTRAVSSAIAIRQTVSGIDPFWLLLLLLLVVV